MQKMRGRNDGGKEKRREGTDRNMEMLDLHNVCVLSPYFVQHPSEDGDEGDPRWISRCTTNWRANTHEPSLR